MRAVLVLDSAFALKERELISRLEIGLADEGVRVAHAVPWTDLLGQQTPLYSVAVGYVPTGLPFTIGQRARMLREALLQAWDLPQEPAVRAPAAKRTTGAVASKSTGAGSGGVGGTPDETTADDGRSPSGVEVIESRIGDQVDIVHAMGWAQGHHEPIAWGMARALAKELRAGLVLEVCEGGQVGRAAHWLERSWGQRAAELDEPPIALLCADEAIEREARARAGVHKRMVTLAPWGVHAPGRARTSELGAAGAGHALSVLLLASDAERGRLAAVLEGVAAARGGGGAGSGDGEPATAGGSESRSGSLGAAAATPLLFAGGDERALEFVWRTGRKLKLLDILTLVPDLEALREPVLQSDAMIVPGGSGRVRTLVLEALALGIPLLTGGDPMVSFLSDDEVVRRVQAPHSGSSWAEAVGRLLRDPKYGHESAVKARKWVLERRPASTHVAAALAAYHVLLRAASNGSEAISGVDAPVAAA